MPHEYILLDPPGYKRCDEPGFHWYINGSSLLAKICHPDGCAPVPATRLFNPAKSDWLLPRPLQFEPDWLKDRDTILHLYVLKESDWTFSPEITGIVEWVPTSKPGTPGAAANIWLSIPQVPAGVTDLGGVNWTSFADAANVTLPAGMAMVGKATTLPGSVASITDAEYTPHLSWLSAPGDDGLFIIGWASYAFLAFRNEGYFLREKLDGKWELLGRIQQDDDRSYRFRANSIVDSMVFESKVFVALPVGLNEIFAYYAGNLENAAPTAVQVRTVDQTSGATGGGPPDGFWAQTEGIVQLGPPLSPHGGWWIAAAPGQSLNFQVQVMGYDAGTEPNYGALNLPFHFDLTDQYQPTVAPKFGGQVVLRGGGGVPPSVTTDGSGFKVYQASDSDQKVTVGINHELAAPWVSDGTHHAGWVDITFNPGNPGVSLGYLAPQINLFELQFPVKLTDRAHNTVTLDDAQFLGWECSVSLEDGGGKRAVVRLFARGAETFVSEGFGERDEFPVEVWTDENNDGTPDTLRAAFWCVDPRLTVKKIKVDDTLLGFYELECVGILHASDELPVYLPQLVNPDGGGFMEHTWAVKEVVRESGIDVDNPARYFDVPDSMAGTAVSRLPGYWGQSPGGNGHRADTTWAMDWEETFLEFCERIKKQWSAWSFYENFVGRVNYHPDLWVNPNEGVAGGYPYFVAAVIYKSSANAKAAGLPGQYWLEDAEYFHHSPQANVVRVTGKDTEGYLLPTLFEQDTDSIQTLGSPNYVGRRKVRAVHTKFAVGTDAMRQTCRTHLRFLRRRVHFWKITVPLPYWMIQYQFVNLAGMTVTQPAGIDVAYVLKLEGLDDYRIIHARDISVTSRTGKSLHYTQFTCDRRPVGATASTTAGAWPGLGA